MAFERVGSRVDTGRRASKCRDIRTREVGIQEIHHKSSTIVEVLSRDSDLWFPVVNILCMGYHIIFNIQLMCFVGNVLNILLNCAFTLLCDMPKP